MPWTIASKNPTAPKVAAAVSCWEHLVSNNEAVDEIPDDIVFAAEKTGMSLSSTTPNKQTNHQTTKQLSTSNEHFRSRVISPKLTPKDRVARIKRSKSNTTATKEMPTEAAPPWKLKTFFNSFGGLSLLDNTNSCNITCHPSSSVVTNLESRIEQQENEQQIIKSEYERFIAEQTNINSTLQRENAELRLKLKNLKVKNKSLQALNSLLQSEKLKNQHVQVHKVRNVQNEKYRTLIKKLISMVTKKRFEVSSKLGKRLLGELISTHPSVSFSVAAEIVTLSRAQLFADVGMLTENDEEGLFSFENIAMSSPSEHALRHALDRTVADVLFSTHLKIFHEEQQIPSVFLSCDKGTQGNFVKVLSWYSAKENKVEQIILDVDVSYGSSQECAEAM